jgi:hypothetical protein
MSPIWERALCFVIGLVAGGMIGIFTMCLIYMAREVDHGDATTETDSPG